MGLEAANTIQGLQASNPLGSDSEGQGDDHLRLIKSVLKTQFPGAGGSGFNTPITSTEAELNFLSGVTSSVQAQLNTLTSSLSSLNALLVAQRIPIGGLVELNVSTNPGTLFGYGTWSAYGEGRTTVALDVSQTEFDVVGEVGGEKTHLLTALESGLRAHTHVLSDSRNVTSMSSGGSSGFAAGTSYLGQAGIASVAAQQATNEHNNLQPYVVVYRWIRVS